MLRPNRCTPAGERQMEDDKKERKPALGRSGALEKKPFQRFLFDLNLVQQEKPL